MKKHKLIFIFLVANSGISGFCQCSYNNTRGPGASANVIVSGSTPWEFPYPSTQSSDNTYTNMRPGTVATSHYLNVYSWGYSFTAGTVCGVKVRVEKSAPSTNSGTVTDLEARLYNGSGNSPNNYADAVTAWPSSDAYFTYGSNSDLWGWASITAAQINSTNFAFRFRAQRTNVNDSAKIDYVEITAHSDEFLPVELLSFDAIKDIENRAVNLKWKCASETNNHFFTVERSKNYMTWATVHTIEGAGNSSLETSYESLDTEPFPGQSYYRLRQTDFDGTTKVLDIISVRFKNYLGDVMIYPSFAVDHVNVKTISDISHSQIIVSAASGRIMKQIFLSEVREVFDCPITVSDLAPGMYFIRIENEDVSICRKFIKR